MSAAMTRGDRAQVCDERTARMALACVSEPGDNALGQLVEAEGALAVWDSLAGPRRSTPWGRRLPGARLAEVRAGMRRRNLRFIMPGDEEWPARLDDLAHVGQGAIKARPLGLWAAGPGHLAQWTARSVAVVGTRTSTRYGEAVAADIAADLAQSGVAVVSGGAYGIDIAAHRGALAVHGRTVAVLASGLDQPYPRGNARVFAELCEHGLIVSELPPGERPSRPRFLGRNRVIAALGVGAVMVEARLRSGAKNTLNWANDLGRVLMAVPGPVTSVYSEGPHDLIRSNGTLVTSAAQIREAIAKLGQEMLPIERGPDRVVDHLDDLLREVFEVVPGRGGRSATEVAERCGRDLLSTIDALAQLEELRLIVNGDRGWKLASGSVG